jgi:hypothetical protein
VKAGGGPSSTALVLLSEPWAELDPTGALDRISTWPAAVRSAAQNPLLRAWARRNRTAALQWVAGIPDSGALLEVVFDGWADAGDPAMWDHVAAIPPPERDVATKAMMQAVVAREGFDGLLARVDALPDDPAPGGFKKAAISTATVLVADHDPARAAAFADRYVGGPYEKGLLSLVAIRWVVRDGRTAVENLFDRPASEERNAALREAYLTWLRREHASALAWVPESEAKDPRFAALVDLYAVALANNDPEHRSDAIRSGIRWAEGIPDAAMRHETLLRLGVMWLYFEPDTATPWLVQNGLEAEARERMAFYERVKQQLTGQAQ